MIYSLFTQSPDKNPWKIKFFLTQPNFGLMTLRKWGSEPLQHSLHLSIYRDMNKEPFNKILLEFSHKSNTKRSKIQENSSEDEKVIKKQSLVFSMQFNNLAEIIVMDITYDQLNLSGRKERFFKESISVKKYIIIENKIGEIVMIQNIFKFTHQIVIRDQQFVAFMRITSLRAEIVTKSGATHCEQFKFKNMAKAREMSRMILKGIPSNFLGGFAIDIWEIRVQEDAVPADGKRANNALTRQEKMTSTYSSEAAGFAASKTTSKHATIYVDVFATQKITIHHSSEAAGFAASKTTSKHATIYVDVFAIQKITRISSEASGFAASNTTSKHATIYVDVFAIQKRTRISSEAAGFAELSHIMKHNIGDGIEDGTTKKRRISRTVRLNKHLVAKTLTIGYSSL